MGDTVRGYVMLTEEEYFHFNRKTSVIGVVTTTINLSYLYDRQDLLRKLRNSRTQYVVVTYTSVLGKVIQAFCNLGNVMVKVHDKEDGVFPRLASWRWGNEI